VTQISDLNIHVLGRLKNVSLLVKISWPLQKIGPFHIIHFFFGYNFSGPLYSGQGTAIPVEILF